jgi:predicted amidohydrolase
MSTLALSLVQANIRWENKQKNLSAFSEKILVLPLNTELVILPEMFNTGFSMHVEKLAEGMDGQTISWMKDEAISNKVIITGSLIIQENNQYFNRLVWMLPNGEFGFYDKRHLFAYADEHHHFAPGKNRLIASVKGWKINLQICYDLRFPVWGRQQHYLQNGNEPEYDLLVYVANWPEARVQAWQTLLQARAIENLCYVAGVNRVGEDGNKIQYPGSSMLIDPLGNILHEAGNKEEAFSFVLQKEELTAVRKKFPFLKDADQFNINS